MRIKQALSSLIVLYVIWWHGVFLEMRLKSKAYIRFFVGMFTAISMGLSFTGLPGFAESTHDAVAYEEDGVAAKELQMPLYHWFTPNVKPRGVVLAIHGLAMHGYSFDALGRSLALQGFDVYSTDLRGYGRCMDEHHSYCSDRGHCKHKIDYHKSYEDIRRLAQYIKDKDQVPLFVAGESLGGALTIKLASCDPQLVDGMILSAPAIKRHWFVDPYMVANAGIFLANPRAQLDLMPFVRKFSSDDPRVVAEKECDPLLRRTLSAYELFLANNAVRKTVSYVSAIPATTPVLVLQGGGDKCLKANAVMLLLSKLHSRDQTVKWFAQRGHILIETSFVKPDTMGAVVQWLNNHVESESHAQAALPEPLAVKVTTATRLYAVSKNDMSLLQH